jgi:hypothetical protein
LSVSFAAEMAPPKPAPEHQKLDYLLGTWTTETENKASVFGPAGKSTGKQIVEKMPGGFFITMRWEGKSPAGPMHGLGVMGYDIKSKAYTFSGFDNMGWRGLGEGKIQGKIWTWTTEDHMGDKVVKGRYTMTEISPTAYTYKYEVQGDNGTYSTIDDGKATKQK